MTASEDKNALLAAYLVNGEDELKRQAVLKRLRARVEKLGDLSFNSDSFSGINASGAEIISACNTLPFLSDVRLVVVTDAESLKKADSEQIVDYLADPAPTTVLALVAAKLPKSSRLYKAVGALGKNAIIDCAPLKRAELPRTVVAMGKQHGVSLTYAAAQKLIELIGENTVALDAEVQKLALAHVEGGAIDDQIVESLVERRAEAKPWDLSDALSRRDVKACMEVLGRLDSASEYTLLNQCTTRIRELMCAKALEQRGAAQSLADTLHLPSWRVRDHVRYSHNYSGEELRRALMASCDAEKAMKSGSPPHATFVQWLLSVVSK
ncbi:MAG: DNA polymerase III subunit delta [Eggerthellaceae bacterium]|nr:DNA polymerase III subunit delta [Eggerthellaceae bacterium]